MLLIKHLFVLCCLIVLAIAAPQKNETKSDDESKRVDDALPPDESKRIDDALQPTEEPAKEPEIERKMGGALPRPDDTARRMGGALPRPDDTARRMGEALPRPDDTARRMGGALPRPDDTARRMGGALPRPEIGRRFAGLRVDDSEGAGDKSVALMPVVIGKSDANTKTEIKSLLEKLEAIIVPATNLYVNLEKLLKEAKSSTKPKQSILSAADVARMVGIQPLENLKEKKSNFHEAVKKHLRSGDIQKAVKSEEVPVIKIENVPVPSNGTVPASR